MTVITLCGSSRFPDAHLLVQMHEALVGNIVIPMSLYGHADFPEGAEFLTSDGDESTPEKQGLDELHLRKIDLADEVLVVNVGGYVGSSTEREIQYALDEGKRVRTLFPELKVRATGLGARLALHMKETREPVRLDGVEVKPEPGFNNDFGHDSLG
jgi:hypothetical protein